MHIHIFQHFFVTFVLQHRSALQEDSHVNIRYICSWCFNSVVSSWLVLLPLVYLSYILEENAAVRWNDLRRRMFVQHCTHFKNHEAIRTLTAKNIFFQMSLLSNLPKHCPCLRSASHDKSPIFYSYFSPSEWSLLSYWNRDFVCFVFLIIPLFRNKYYSHRAIHISLRSISASQEYSYERLDVYVTYISYEYNLTLYVYSLAHIAVRSFLLHFFLFDFDQSTFTHSFFHSSVKSFQLGFA